MSQRSQKSPKPKAPAVSVISPAEGLAQWDKLLREFLKEHPDWVRHLHAEDAAYALPEKIVTELASPRGGHRQLDALIGESDAIAEREFVALCRSFGPHTIGVWQRDPIVFPLLSKSWPIEGLGETPAPQRQAAPVMPPDITQEDLVKGQRAVQVTVDRQHQQQLAYVGTLSFHTPYRQELEQLKQMWRLLPQPKPVAGPCSDERLALKVGVAGPSIKYYEAYDVFRARWHLASLVSWDVPWPMGRGDKLPIDVLKTLFGKSGEASYCPPYLDTPRESIQEKMKFAEAMAKQSPPSPKPPPIARMIGRGRGPSEYATAFRLSLLELTVRRRYGESHGLKASLIRDFSKWLGIGEVQIRRLRRIYTRFLSLSHR